MGGIGSCESPGGSAAPTGPLPGDARTTHGEKARIGGCRVKVVVGGEPAIMSCFCMSLCIPQAGIRCSGFSNDE